MDSRAIIKREGNLKIFLDTKCFNHHLCKNNLDLEKILNYMNSKPFEFIRSPFDTNNNKLKKILTYYEKYDFKEDLSSIEIIREKSHSCIGFGYKMQDVESVGKTIYDKNFLTKDEKEAVKLVFIQVVLMRSKDSDILISQNGTLLKKRLWLESHFPGLPINTVSLNEAKEIMDLFSKYQNKYYISGNYTCNKGYWYWLSFRQKVPNFHVEDSILKAFSKRFVYLLESLDEMGFQYYLGVNNDTMNTMMYHFNYFISLATGIFDSLAIKTKNKYKLSFKNSNFPSKTSLNKKAGREFLNALRENNPNLRTHINEYVNFIKLIYRLRELLIHGEMLDINSFTFSGGEERYEIGTVKVKGDIINSIKLCGDKIRKYDNFTQWGIFEFNNSYFLEPFHFAKVASKTLVNFSNKYLALLNFKNYIEGLRKNDKNDHFLRSLELFTKNKLGF